MARWWAASQTATGRVCVRLVAQDGHGTRPITYARLGGARLDPDWRGAIVRALSRHCPAEAGQRWQIWNGAAWQDLPAAPRATSPQPPAAVRSAAQQVTKRSVCLLGLTEPQFRDLEATLGLPPGGLGRYKPWSAPHGVHIDGDRFDVDAAIGFANTHGLPYEPTCTNRYEPVRAAVEVV